MDLTTRSVILPKDTIGVKHSGLTAQKASVAWCCKGDFGRVFLVAIHGYFLIRPLVLQVACAVTQGSTQLARHCSPPCCTG